MNQEITKCNRLFRPWDNVSGTSEKKLKIKTLNFESGHQDCTISTTTDAENAETFKTEETSICDTNVKQKLNICKTASEINDKTENCQVKLPTYFPPSTKLETSKLIIQQSFHEKSANICQPVPNSYENHCRYLETSPNNVGNSKLPVQSDFLLPAQDYQFYSDLVNSGGSMDSMFSDFMHHGYSFEEYARVLNQEHQAKLLSSKKQRPKKYKCPHCDVGFSNNGQLKGHIRIHTGERPFRCEEKNCGKTFTRNEELTRHKRIHSGLRPFACSHCGKRFGRKDHLKKHSRTHFQPREIYAVPVVLPLDVWNPTSYNYMPLFGY